ncbi:MAG: hypothetical protein WA842_00930, partial [Croceibacterium sp.]
MATIPLTGMEGKAPAKPPKPPISQHPAFPAIVGLWFAALLGLGSLVLPVVLLESIVTTTGINALVPAATPPLGFTARALLALLAAVTGAGLGLLLARQLAAGHRPEGRSRMARTGHRPLNARLDLGEDGLLASGVKRRSLAITDESRQSDFLSHAPLPGEDPWAAPVSVSALFDRAPQDEEPLFDTDAAPTFDPFAPPHYSPDPDTYEPFDLALDDEAAPEADLHEDAFMTDKQEFQPLTLGQQEELQRQDFFPRAEPASFGRAVRAEAPDAAAPASAMVEPVAESVESEPLHFAAPSLARHEEEPVAAADDGKRNSEEPGMLQLVQRLGHSLEKRRETLALDAQKQLEALAQVPESETAPAATPQAFEAARPEEAAQAMAAFFGKPAGVPAPRAAAPAFGEDFGSDIDSPVFERPGFTVPGVAFAAPAEAEAELPHHFTHGLAHLSSDETSAAEYDGEDDDFLPASFTLPLRTAMVVDDVAEDDDETEFGSLLSLNNPFANKEPAFVRVEEPDSADALPPAGGVVFPGQIDNRAAIRPDPTDIGGRMFDRPAVGATPRKPAPEMDE